MQPTTIEPIEADDIPSVGSIYRQAVRHGTATFEIDPPDDREMAHRAEILLAGGFPCFVARRGPQIVGWKHGRWLDVTLMQRPLGSGSSEPA
jgi:L-amino acid N-acyltransferase YncA